MILLQWWGLPQAIDKALGGASSLAIEQSTRAKVVPAYRHFENREGPAIAGRAGIVSGIASKMTRLTVGARKSARICRRLRDDSHRGAILSNLNCCR